MTRVEPFGHTPAGEAATLYTLESGRLRVCITDYGGRMVSIEAPDRDGRSGHVLLGFDDVAQYAVNGGSFGALLGRNANRIGRAELPIDGRTYKLIITDRGNTLHGGPRGFGMVMWRVVKADDTELVLTHTSPDGDQGFPGEMAVEARYRLAAEALSLTLTAQTDKPTDASLSAHPYFNLAGTAAGDVLSHEVMIAADAFLPTDATQLATGEIRLVEGTVFDLRQPTVIGSRIRQPEPQLLLAQGFDHFFIVGSTTVQEPRFVARLRDPGSGRVVEIHTTQPGLQFYTGNQLRGAFAGRGEVAYRQSAGVAFEPQGFLDAAHHANFSTTTLRPGELYRQIIEYQFGAA
ncbi:MAG TPA: aldose epimerase family protein [Stellaceae bacterium]|nr:aldose epimerase family protein [Stellaceae bacterium]